MERRIPYGGSVFSDWWFNFAVWPESCRQAIESCDIRRNVSSLSEAVRLKNFITFLPFQVSCEMKILMLGCRLLADSFIYTSALEVDCINVAVSGKLSASTGDCTDSVSMWSVIAAVSISTDGTIKHTWIRKTFSIQVVRHIEAMLFTPLIDAML